MTSAGDLATVHNTTGTRIAGQHRKPDKIALRLQFRTLLRVFLDDSLLLLVALNPALLGHKGEKR